MKKLIIALTFLLIYNSGFAQTENIEAPADQHGNMKIVTVPMKKSFAPLVPVTGTLDTLQYYGANKIDIVLIGDGFTAGAQQDSLTLYAKKFIAKFNTTIPFLFYVNRFNFYMLFTASAQSGCKHPHTAPDCPIGMPITNPSTALGCTFDYGGIHRLLYCPNGGTVNSLLVQYAPFYDYACILVNSPYYGGSGGTYPTASCNIQSADILLHELNHRMTNAGDEYSGTSCGGEHYNTASVFNWIPKFFKVSGADYCPTHYCDSTTCKMRNVSSPFCSVCRDSLKRYILNHSTPPTVATPTILTATNVTSTGFALNCNTILNATNYLWAYRVVGTTKYTTTLTSVPSLTVTGMLPNTTYQWAVQSRYMSNGAWVMSAYSVKVTVTTLQ